MPPSNAPPAPCSPPTAGDFQYVIQDVSLYNSANFQNYTIFFSIFAILSGLHSFVATKRSSTTHLQISSSGSQIIIARFTFKLVYVGLIFSVQRPKTYKIFPIDCSQLEESFKSSLQYVYTVPSQFGPAVSILCCAKF